MKPLREALSALEGRIPPCDFCVNGKAPVDIAGNVYYIGCPAISQECKAGKQVVRRLIKSVAAQIKSLPDLPVMFHKYLENPDPTVAVKGVRQWNWKAANFLVLHGAHGTGKSFGAAYALYLLLREKLLPEWRRPELWNSRNFDALWTSAYRISNIDSVYEHARRVNYLVVDDLGSEDPTVHHRNRLVDVISRRYDMRKTTILTMNEDVIELEDLYGRRMFDRIVGFGYTIYCGGESLRLSIKFDEEGNIVHAR
jgi:hypothetical protein